MRWLLALLRPRPPAPKASKYPWTEVYSADLKARLIAVGVAPVNERGR